MTRPRRRLLWTLALLGGAYVACRGAREPAPSGGEAGSTSLTSATLSSPNDDAIMAVSTARCERELACNKIGSGRQHEDQASCLEALGHDVERDIGLPECTKGIDQNALATCLADIRAEPCGGRPERGDELPSCQRGAICKR